MINKGIQKQTTIRLSWIDKHGDEHNFSFTDETLDGDETAELKARDMGKTAYQLAKKGGADKIRSNVRVARTVIIETEAIINIKEQK